MKIGMLYYLSVFLLFSSQATAEVFAGFDSFCDLPVIVGADSQVASARTDRRGRKFIHVDPKAMANWTASRMFVLAHECAHHRLGHTSVLGNYERFRGGTARQELEADCWAARKLASIGFEREITRTILERASQGHFSQNNYPSGYQRASNIADCAGGSVGRRCRDVREPQTYTDYEFKLRPVNVPCRHCGCNPWGQCSCAHQFDQVPQQVQVPVQKVRYVTRRVCN